MTLRCEDCGSVYCWFRDDLDAMLCSPCVEDRRQVSGRWPA